MFCYFALTRPSNTSCYDIGSTKFNMFLSETVNLFFFKYFYKISSANDYLVICFISKELQLKGVDLNLKNSLKLVA